MKKAVFIDCGDTLVDESTQIFDDEGNVIDVKFFDGAKELLCRLKSKGYIVVLVADGRVKSFENIFNKIGFLNEFDGFVVSEKVGALKPDSKMFEAAFNLLPEDIRNKENIVMVGNNLKRDIKGANNFGITSVWLNLSPRYFHEFEEGDWQPDYEIHSPLELMDLLENTLS
ncbi:MAG: HAD family hydrolase [Lachnospiraceae bacterium]